MAGLLKEGPIVRERGRSGQPPRATDLQCPSMITALRASFLLFVLLVATGCVSVPPGTMDTTGASPSAGVRRLYRLPFAVGTRHLCVQGGPGPFSHSGSQRYALDFRMPVGTPVLAARDGRVVGVKEDSDTGGASRAHAEEGNFVHVLHDDGTRAVYLHLKKGGAAVGIGQVVRRGQVIAFSGDTGWSAMPHLHFEVDARDPGTGRWASIPVAFADVEGDGVPQMLMIYESGNTVVAGAATGPGGGP